MSALRWEARGDVIGYVEDGRFTAVAVTIDGDTGAAESMAASQQVTAKLTDDEIAALVQSESALEAIDCLAKAKTLAAKLARHGGGQRAPEGGQSVASTGARISSDEVSPWD